MAYPQTVSWTAPRPRSSLELGPDRLQVALAADEERGRLVDTRCPVGLEALPDVLGVAGEHQAVHGSPSRCPSPPHPGSVPRCTSALHSGPAHDCSHSGLGQPVPVWVSRLRPEAESSALVSPLRPTSWSTAGSMRAGSVAAGEAGGGVVPSAPVDRGAATPARPQSARPSVPARTDITRACRGCSTAVLCRLQCWSGGLFGWLPGSVPAHAATVPVRTGAAGVRAGPGAGRGRSGLGLGCRGAQLICCGRCGATAPARW